LPVLPVVNAPKGKGRLVHPTLGALDYDTKPDSWANIDGDAIIAPTWSSTKTLLSAANVLWQGNIRDVEVTESWTQPMSMTMAQMRMLIAFWSNPVDPLIGYVQWWPNYANSNGYNVLLTSLQAGRSGITLTDLGNYVDADDNNIGWMENPVTLTLKLVAKLG
jgi:hypothetical protein